MPVVNLSLALQRADISMLDCKLIHHIERHGQSIAMYTTDGPPVIVLDQQTMIDGSGGALLKEGQEMQFFMRQPISIMNLL